MLENIYLVFLFLIVILSTSVKVEWAETGFRIASFFMGVLSILMVVCSVIYAIDGINQED